MYLEERAAEMALITPKGEKTHRITYGEPPCSLGSYTMAETVLPSSMTLIATGKRVFIRGDWKRVPMIPVHRDSERRT
jgi:hypothetical protein